MNSYTAFSEIYDSLMKQDIDYSRIADYIENIFILHGKSPDMVVDLACGTGNLTIPLAERGYDMIGIDRSADMLSIAREKSVGKDILFLNQDMTKLDLYGTADAFLCMIDGINYCLNPNSVYKMLKKIKTCFLNENGIVIFDVSSEYKLSSVIGNNTFIHNEEDIFYSWENKYYEKLKVSDMYLNFFVKGNGGYKRFSERHLQKAYSIELIQQMLDKAGFKKVTVYGDFTFDKPSKRAERIIFVAE